MYVIFPNGSSYLQTGTPAVIDINVCFGPDLRAGYEDHSYAYVTWSYTDDIGM